MNQEIKKSFDKTIKLFGNNIVPEPIKIWEQFELLKDVDIKVVILSTNPTLSPNAIDWIPISSNPTTKLPEHLKNFNKVLKPEFKIVKGHLINWVKQGVMLWLLSPTFRMIGEDRQNMFIEWYNFNKALFTEIGKKDILVWTSGTESYEFAAKYIKSNNLISTTHYSKLGWNQKSNKMITFKDSKVFNLINVKLQEKGLQTINWNN